MPITIEQVFHQKETLPTVNTKHAQHDEIKRLTAEFEARGGKIREIPTAYRTHEQNLATIGRQGNESHFCEPNDQRWHRLMQSVCKRLRCDAETNLSDLYLTMGHRREVILSALKKAAKAGYVNLREGRQTVKDGVMSTDISRSGSWAKLTDFGKEWVGS